MQSLFEASIQPDEKLLELSSKIDSFECYSSGQSRRIASLSAALGNAFNLASRDRFFLEQAALIHDIGELSMNRDYISLLKGLTTNQRLDLERHPVIGEQESAKLGMPRGVQLIIRWHHEWWNGGGYPDGLERDQIPLAARILRVTDTFAAMTASRPFRMALSDDDAKKYIREWAGIEFDPAVVKAFLALDIDDVAVNSVNLLADSFPVFQTL